MISPQSLPLVSVVIPTFNHAHFLKETLAALKAQSYDNWQAIIVNNYSTDTTEAVIDSFKDSRITTINYANNGIIAASRNRGIEMSEGDYIAFLDSDDYWYPEKLDRCIQTLTTQKLDWVCHGEQWFGDGIQKDVFYGPLSRASFEGLLYRGNCISTSAVVVKRELLVTVGGFSESADFVTAEDYFLWLRLAQTGAKLGFIEQILGAYRIHTTNQSRGALRNMQATSAVVEHFFSTSPTQILYEKLRRRNRRGGVYYSGARALQNLRNHRQAWPLFYKAFCLSPFDIRIVPAMVMNLLGLRF